LPKSLYASHAIRARASVVSIAQYARGRSDYSCRHTFPRQGRELMSEFMGLLIFRFKLIFLQFSLIERNIHHMRRTRNFELSDTDLLYL
jgi:hypothetical protein